MSNGITPYISGSGTVQAAGIPRVLIIYTPGNKGTVSMCERLSSIKNEINPRIFGFWRLVKIKDNALLTRKVFSTSHGSFRHGYRSSFILHQSDVITVWYSHVSSLFDPSCDSTLHIHFFTSAHTNANDNSESFLDQNAPSFTSSHV
jgi:hypothetical protein